MRTRNLQPAWKTLKISLVLFVSYYLLLVLTSLFVIVPMEGDLRRTYISSTILTALDNVLIVLFYIVLFIFLKKLIWKSVKGIKSFGVLTLLYGIFVLAFSASGKAFDIVKYAVLMKENLSPADTITLFVYKTPYQSITMIAANVYAALCSIIFVAAIVFLMFTYALIWYENWLGKNNNIDIPVDK